MGKIEILDMKRENNILSLPYNNILSLPYFVLSKYKELTKNEEIMDWESGFLVSF